MNRNRTYIAAATIALLANLPLTGSAQTSADPHHPTDPTADQKAGSAAQRMPMMDMSGMARMMNRRAATMGSMGMPMFDHVEGRIAFLKAEIKITDAQASSWNGFADALRADAKKMGEMRQAMMKAGTARATFADSLETRERWLSARLDGARAIKAAYATLFPNLSDEQKKMADELLAPPMGLGMMAMGGMGRPAQ
jgi:hypothetical protein